MRTRLKLDLEELSVDSFDTAAVAVEKGTVFAEQCTCYTNCTCPGCPTCDHTACEQHTCAAMCSATCYSACGHTCTETTALYTNCGDMICY